jgi:hypothetical protein
MPYCGYVRQRGSFVSGFSVQVSGKIRNLKHTAFLSSS